MSISRKTRFRVGDWTVHYKFGVGKVEDIVEKGVGSDRQTFYKITTKKITYWLPLDNEDCDYIEPIRSKHDFQNALKILSQAPEPIDTQIRSRKNTVHERWLDSSLEGRASLLRDLNGCNKLQKLNFNEKELLFKIRQTFISEWILSDRSMTYNQAQEGLDQALKIGMAHH
jgi:RNA polymerase-interacting CarD/CdnL/TRCF family regulator